MTSQWQQYAAHILEEQRTVMEANEAQFRREEITLFTELLQNTLCNNDESRQAYALMTAGHSVEMVGKRVQMALDGFTLYMVDSETTISIGDSDGFYKQFPAWREIWGEVENAEPIKVATWADIGRLLNMVSARKVLS